MEKQVRCFMDCPLNRNRLRFVLRASRLDAEEFAHALAYADVHSISAMLENDKLMDLELVSRLDFSRSIHFKWHKE